MKKTLIFVFLISFVASAWASDQTIIKREDISIKAGPTAPGEKLSMLWIESYVYPKVLNDGQVISLGVRLTSKIKAVVASFDFNDEQVSLSSHDGLNWSGAYKISTDVPDGVHVVRYTLVDVKGSINRTVDFFVEKPAAGLIENKKIVGGEVFDINGWPLTITATCSALIDGSTRILYAGQKVTGISKLPWYKVVFEDGEEGWISAASIKEPLDEYYELGQKAAQAENPAQAIEHYKDALSIEPDFVKAYIGLAESYEKLGKYDAAYRAINEAMRLDERNMESKIFASNLADRFKKQAHSKYVNGRYHEAIAAYQKVLDLQPNTTVAWVEMGKSYKRLGFAAKARDSWKEALKYDPQNQQLYALLNIRQPRSVAVAAAPEKAIAPKVAQQVSRQTGPATKVPDLIADDSLDIVKAGKTNKGTRIDSALNSVVALARSLGTPVAEKGWQIKQKGEKFLVRYICEQGQDVFEAFEWMVDVDTRGITASNDNARLLMNRW